MAKILSVDEAERCIGCYSCMAACARFNFHSFTPHISALTVKSIGAALERYHIESCSGCLEPACASACRTKALVFRKGGGVVFDASKCLGCGACAKACTIQVLKFDDSKKIPLVCRHCGICAKFCPHECLVMREKIINL